MITENKLLEELIASERLPNLDPLLDVTAEMFAAKLGITQRAASQKLRALVRSGKLTCQWVRKQDGHRVLAFRRPNFVAKP